MRRLQGALGALIVAGLLLRLGAWALDPLVSGLGYLLVVVTVAVMLLPRRPYR
jgi:hypothetical protein